MSSSSSSAPAFPPPSETDVYRTAMEKMTRILGAQRAEHLMQKFLAKRPVFTTSDDLFAIATTLSNLDGIESAVGALLCTRAILMGASTKAA